MNYKWHYDKLIETRRARTPVSGVYYEKHHIVMKSMGGTNDKENLVLLTAREHFLAHLLLWKIYRNKQSAHALNSMSRSSLNNKRLVLSSRQYNEVREAHSLEVTKSNLLRVDEFKKSIKTYRENKGPTFSRPRTEDEKALMRLKNAGGKNAIAKKTYQYDSNFNLLKIWECKADLVRNFTDLSDSKIGRAARYNTKKSKSQEFKVLSNFIITYNPII